MHTSLRFLTAIVLTLPFANLPLVAGADINSDIGSAPQNTKDSRHVAGTSNHHSHKGGIYHSHKHPRAAKGKDDGPANIDIETFSDNKCTESASTIWKKNDGVNYNQNYSAFDTLRTGDTTGSKEYVTFHSYRISRGLLGNEVLDFSDKGSEAEGWCDKYSFTADSNTPADCYTTAAFSCFTLRKAPDSQTPPPERDSETVERDSEDASRKILAREDASSDTPDIVQRSGGDSGLDITAYYSKKGCKKNDPDPKAHTVIRNLAYNVGTQIPTHSKNYQSLRISRDLGNNEYLVIDTDGADEGTWWCWEEHKAGCCENAEGFTFNHVTLVLEKEGRPRAV